MTDFILFR